MKIGLLTDKRGFFFLLLLILHSASAQINSPKKITRNKAPFTENKGQVSDQNHRPRPDVLFSAEMDGMVYHLRKGGLSIQQYRVDSWKKRESILDKAKESDNIKEVPDSMTVYRTDFNWVGAHSDFSLQQGSAARDYSNYYLPVCPEGATHVRSYEEVTYRELYDNIAVKFYNNNGSLEYDYLLAPYADYRQIRWEVEGAKELFVNEKGQLVVVTPLGEIRKEAPVGFQENKEIVVQWRLENDHVVGMYIPGYDPSLPLIIDPIVRQWGTYYGGSLLDEIWDSAIDDSSNTYSAGTTSSPSNIATAGSHQQNLNAYNEAFLTKTDSNGSRQWCTYYGDTASDNGRACFIDQSFNVYLVGNTYTNSLIKPTTQGVLATANGHQPIHGGGSIDAFLAKFDSNGIRQWGTYYGGEGDETGLGCTVDAANNVYLTGYSTDTSTAIATAGSHQSILGGNGDAYLVKFNSNGVRQWATYYGGADFEVGWSCRSDASSNVYLIGWTESTSGISTIGSHQEIYGGNVDGFVAKFNSYGVRQWGTYYGGSGYDQVIGVTIDPGGTPYFAGVTSSYNAISTSGCHQFFKGGGADGFLAKFSALGSRQWATYYGGAYDDHISSCAVDASLNVYITGKTASSTAISTNTAYQAAIGGNEDAFLVKFYDGVRIWGTYYGGLAEDWAHSVLIGRHDHLYLTGYTNSSNAMASMGSHQSTYGGGAYDGFLVKFRHCEADSVSIFPKVCEVYASPSGKHTWTQSGLYYDTLANISGCDSIILIDLTVEKHVSAAIAVTACDEYISPSGKDIYQVSGIYQDTILSAGGCDSAMTIDLTIVTIDDAVTREGARLTAHANGVAYQWLDCDNGNTPITLATDQVFNATTNGRYAVELTKNDCRDTSDCYLVSSVGIGNQENDAGIRIFPNPAHKTLFIGSGNKNLAGGVFQVFDQQGKLVWKSPIRNAGHTVQIDVSAWSRGLYFVRIIGAGIYFQERVVLE